MAAYRIEKSTTGARRRFGLGALALLLFLLLMFARSIARYIVEYHWWKEMAQVSTWVGLLTYGLAPVAAATVVAFAVLWTAHARGMKFAGAALRENRGYAKLATLGALLLGYLVAAASMDGWTVVRYAGSRGLGAAANAWHDPVFGQSLSFYLFDLPFYSALRGYLLTLAVVSILVYWLTARAWQLRSRLYELREMKEVDPTILRLEGGLESRFLRGAAAVFLLALAFRFFLARYEMVYNEHGAFMVGIDYVDQNWGLPLQWLVIAACLAAAVFVSFGRWVWAVSMALALPIQFAVPKLVAVLYVQPNEISIQRPYIQTHIRATRSAFGLDARLKEMEFRALQDAPIDAAAHKHLLDNVRLWDWRAFHDTITQIQALRPYYVFPDSDVDRYKIDGEYRQVLLAPRELDLRQLPDAQTRWINPHFIYTHGYGVVMSEVARITPEGLPHLIIQDAPPEVKTTSLKITRPEIYYGEATHEPVFVRTAQQEFNYPSGADNVHSRYDGTGGFPISSLGMRVAAALSQGDANILLTNYLTPESRMMIRRRVRERLQALAGFLVWDTDPYLVVTEAGRLVWMVDAFTTSNAHPYARSVNVPNTGAVNYIRNAVKATVDAYDGSARLYVFAPEDPLIQAYERIFPNLLLPASQMPADLRAHARYPDPLFRAQAEIYRTYHMLDPQAFYNKEDLWDLARFTPQQGAQPQPFTPTYVIASLPGQDQAEFLLLMPFTPRNKDNMVGLMLARCDGERLGELVVLQLSKQELIFGPMQVAARVNQDQNISKDLSLWNQQGSTVLRGQILVLPIGDTFLYVDPMYIQATEARMPQLKKVVLAVGNRLIYADTYEQALAQLTSGARQLIQQAAAPPAKPPAAGAAAAATPVAAPAAEEKLQRVREHLRRYRELAAQGRWGEAGKELEAIEAASKY